MEDRGWDVGGTCSDGPHGGFPFAAGVRTAARGADDLLKMKGALGIPTIRPGGKLGNVVFVRSGDGYVVRERVTPANPRTAAQTRARRGFAQASQGWARLTDAEFEAWQAYAEPSGRPANNVYQSLTRKWLAVHGEGTPPTMPPTGPFFGDAVRVRIVEPGGRSGESASPLDVPNSRLLTLLSDRPNSAGVVVEILVQSLANARRKPRERDWRTAAFVAFTAAAPTAAILLPPGAWAVAYRFVESTTGQATGMAPLGSVTLG